MKNLKKLLGCVALVTFSMSLSAQEQVQGFVHQQSKATDYVWPTDQQVLDQQAAFYSEASQLRTRLGVHQLDGASLLDLWLFHECLCEA